MNTKELREGNFVRIIRNNSLNIMGIVKVEDVISGCGINMHHDSWIHNIDDLEAILITPSLFEALEQSTLLQIDGNSYHLTSYINENDELSYHLVINNEKLPPVKYIHQLQNQFYSLSLHELDLDDALI